MDALEHRSNFVKMVVVTTSGRMPRRTDALSRDRILRTAVELLDAGGEGALTFPAPAVQLATGAGAIYWHVANQEELLAAATGDVITKVLARLPDQGEQRTQIRALALGLFDAIDAHP